MPRSKQEAMKRKKTRGRVRKEAPLPILMRDTGTSFMTNPPCCFFTGYLQGCTVVVQHSGDMEFLYNMGFFGKGSLSRSEPTFNARHQRVNIPSLKKESVGGMEMVQAVVTSRRKYLAHLRYKTLSDDEESLYNDIVQEELSQLPLVEGEEEDEEELDEEEEEYEEEEDEEEILDSSDINILSRFGFTSDKNTVSLNTKLTPEELSKMPRSLIVALMGQVAVLSKQQIATFLRVPCGLAELQTKYKIMRQKQVDFLENIAKGHNPSLTSTLGKSSSSSNNYSSKGDGFGKKGIINLEGGDDDSVVVLNSDDSEKEEESVYDEEISKEEKKDNSIKGWDDSDNEGDADFWGVGEGEEEKKKDANEKGKDVLTPVSRDELKKNSDKAITDDSCVDRKNSCGENNSKEIAKIAENSDCLQEADESVKMNDESDPSKGENVREQIKDLADENCKEIEKEKNAESHTKGDVTNDFKIPLGKVKNNKSSEEFKSPMSVRADDSAQIVPSLSTTSAVTEEANNDEDDDDVICMEEESAQPAKLHQYLSQSTGRRIINKPVCFLSSITNESKLIDTRLGFKTWDDVLHFNFTGDPTHLPTGMAVREGGDGDSESTVIDRFSQQNSVYERIYPPVSSLIASRNSKGSVMKQRLDAVPFLDLALFNLQQRFAPKMASHSSDMSLPSAPSLNRPSQMAQMKSGELSQRQYPVTTISRHPNSHLHQLHQSSQNPSLWSKNVNFSQPPRYASTPQGVSSHATPLLSSSSSLSSSLLTSSVNPSQLELYLGVFQQDKDSEMGNDEEKQKLLNSNEDKDSDITLQTLHAQLSKTGLLKNPVKHFDGDQQQELDNSIDEQSALHIFNKMLSDYLASKQISLEQELIILRILMYEKNVMSTSIPREFVSNLKSKMCPGQESCLLERMDYVQICVESRRRDVSNEEVITIDLSDDDDDKGNSPRLNDKKVVEKLVKDFNGESGVGNIPQVENAGDDNRLAIGQKRRLESSPENAAMSESKIRKSDEMLNHISQRGTGAEINPSGNNSSLEHDKNADNNDTCEAESGGDAVLLKKLDSKELTSQKAVDCNGDKKCRDENYSEVKKLESENITAMEGVEETAETEIKSSVVSEDENEGSSLLNAGRVKPNEIYVGSSEEDEEKEVEDGSGFLGGKKLYENWYGNGPANPFSLKDDDYGDSFVIANTSDDDDNDETDDVVMKNDVGGGGWVRQNNKWQPCLKKDPYPTEERLHLLLEEAFFLSFGLGCLRILDQEMTPLNLSLLWQRFLVIQEKFIPRYVAYHYFRSKGWVPKSGLKFGCDFILYREGPPFYHGSFSVVVVPVREGTLTHMDWENGELDFSRRWTSWISLAGLNRITEQVSKELMICYVIFPKGLTEEESKSPKCIPEFKVKEVVVSRWVSSREREAKELPEDMP